MHVIKRKRKKGKEEDCTLSSRVHNSLHLENDGNAKFGLHACLLHHASGQSPFDCAWVVVAAQKVEAYAAEKSRFIDPSIDITPSITISSLGDAHRDQVLSLAAAAGNSPVQILLSSPTLNFRPDLCRVRMNVPLKALQYY